MPFLKELMVTSNVWIIVPTCFDQQQLQLEWEGEQLLKSSKKQANKVYRITGQEKEKNFRTKSKTLTFCLEKLMEINATELKGCRLDGKKTP